MYRSGYHEEIARRSSIKGGERTLTAGNALALAAFAVGFLTLVWCHLASPAWNVGSKIATASEAKRKGVEALMPVVGRCFDNGRGAIGEAVFIVDADNVRLSFANGYSNLYPASALLPAKCRSK